VSQAVAQGVIAAFRGTVTCAYVPGVAPALTVQGIAAAPPHERIILTFRGECAPALPERLQDAIVTTLDARQFRIESPAGQWLISARALHVHRDIGAVFFRAIRPRRVPLRKRLFWAGVLVLARSGPGLRLLRRLRG